MKFIKQVINENLNPVYVKDGNGKFILANNAYTNLHGLTVAGLLQAGTFNSDYSSEKDLDLLQTGGSFKTEEFYKLRNGQDVWLHTTKKVYTEPDGTRYLLSFSSDITHWKKALLMAEEAAKTEKETVTKFSKELGASINAIVGVAKLVRSNVYDYETREEYLNTIITIADNLLANLPYQDTQRSHLNGYDLTAEASQGEFRVLLAEDNPMNRLLAMSQLKSWKIDVELAHDGEEAVSKARENIYDLILMDIQMPKLDGLNATNQIRNETNPNQYTPIIAFTANLLQIEIEQYMQIGFTDFLLKPYDEVSFHYLISKYRGQTKNTYAANTVPNNLESDLFDFSGLGNMAEDAVFIQKMKRLFIDLVPKQLEELSEAILQQKWGEAADLSHRLKSTYGNIKINEAADAMKKIEESAREKINLDQITDLMGIAKDITDKVVTQFLRANP